MPKVFADESKQKSFVSDMERNASEVVLERDLSSIQSDRRMLLDLTAGSDKPALRFQLVERHHEPLLWIGDAVAWAHQRGGDYWARLSTSGVRVIKLD
jgi:hypothetical protein